MVQDINATFGTVRTVVYIVASVFAFLELALGAAITNWTSTRFFGGYFSFAALGIATGILTFLTLPVMLFFSRSRKGAIPNMVAIEAGWTWFLWIMWVSVGGSSASTIWITDCNDRFDSSVETVCREIQAFTAFGFLTWIMLLAYNFFLLFLVIRQHMRGNTNVWTGFVTETDFDAVGTYATGVNEQKMSPGFAPQYPPSQPPQGAYGGVPQQQAQSPYPQV